VDRWIANGDVLGCVNWPRRFDHMQQHTGQHLLSAMFQERFGLPTVSFHLGEEICTIDLRGREPSRDVLEGAERAANQVVFEDRPVTVRYGTAEQLAKVGVRKTVEREGILRAIEIEGADLQPCGGTHVRRTGQIGLILVRRCTKMRQDWRVEFVCGGRVQKIARHDFELVQSASEKLGCAPDELPASVERVSTERDAQFKIARAATQLLAEGDARSTLEQISPDQKGLRVVTRVFKGVQPEYVQAFASETAKGEKAVALVARAECGHIFFAQNPSADISMADLLKQVFENVGGKGGGPRDFARGRLSDPAKAQEALDLAKKLLTSS
jgi:alanyl-tRNA synthetase